MTSAAPDAPRRLNLLIKNPTDRPGSDPFTIQLAASSTVLQLKHNLSETYPASPPVHAQRLIYAGKLLDNRATLNDIITATDPSAQHTLHLVVSSPGRAGPAARPAPASASAPTAQPSPSNPTSAPSPSNGANNEAPSTAPPNPQNVPPNPLNPFMSAFPYPINPQQFVLPTIPTHPTQQAPMYNMQYPAAPMPAYPPPPSDNANENEPMYRPPFAPVDPSAYAAHLQAMERIIADSVLAHQNNIQGAAEGQDQDARHAAAAAAASAATAAMHAQAHAQALAAQMANNDAHAQFPPQQQQHGIAFDFRMGRVNHNNPQDADAAQRMPQQPLHPGEPRVRQFVFQFELNWSLISKLILLVFLLGHEGSSARMYTLSGLAVAAYLWQTGRLGFLRRFAATMLPNPAQLVEILFPRQPAPEASGSTAGEGDQAVERPRIRNRFGRLAIILSFVYSFFYGFICSLLPAWRPVPMPDMTEVMNLNANRPVQNEEPEPAAAPNGAAPNDVHEHAD